MKKILKIVIGSIAGLFLALIIIGALSSNTDAPGTDSYNRSAESTSTNGTSASTSLEVTTSTSDSTLNTTQESASPAPSPVQTGSPNDNLYVHFIDVGQADSISKMHNPICGNINVAHNHLQTLFSN